MPRKKVEKNPETEIKEIIKKEPVKRVSKKKIVEPSIKSLEIIKDTSKITTEIQPVEVSLENLSNGIVQVCTGDEVACTEDEVACNPTTDVSRFQPSDVRLTSPAPG